MRRGAGWGVRCRRGRAGAARRCAREHRRRRHDARRPEAGGGAPRARARRQSRAARLPGRGRARRVDCGARSHRAPRLHDRGTRHRCPLGRARAAGGVQRDRAHARARGWPRASDARHRRSPGGPLRKASRAPEVEDILGLGDGCDMLGILAPVRTIRGFTTATQGRTQRAGAWQTPARSTVLRRCLYQRAAPRHPRIHEIPSWRNRGHSQGSDPGRPRCTRTAS
jgi:hypothetical protein